MSIADGYHPLAPGKLATLVTYLEMTAPSAEPPVAAPAGWRLEPVTRWPSLEAFRRLFVEIGWEWLWTSRLMMSDAELDARLHRPSVRTFVPTRDGRSMGLLELDFSHPSDVEVAFFGLVPDAVGAGIGRWMMGEAIAMGFGRPATRRLWLHTCHLDSPKALPFYMRMGFRPYARAVEIFDDPRLLGKLPPGAGPHVPVIAP